MLSHSTVQAHTLLADLLGLDEHQKTRARLRSEFTNLFRMVTGALCYASAKFYQIASRRLGCNPAQSSKVAT